jgi:hypothetical protein
VLLYLRVADMYVAALADAADAPAAAQAAAALVASDTVAMPAWASVELMVAILLEQRDAHRCVHVPVSFG